MIADTLNKRQIVSEHIGAMVAIIDEHCSTMGIYNHTISKKKRNKIIDSVVMSAIMSDIFPEDLLRFIEDVHSDNVIDISFFQKGGNIYEFLNPKWHNFLSLLWTKTPLGTPNSASGEGEFMFVFSSNHITKPTKGDLLVDGVLIELKAEDVRVSSDITGTQFRELTIKLCKKYGLTPNKSNVRKKVLEAVEIEKPAHQNYWINELSKLTIIEKKQFISDYLNCIDNNQHNVEHLFVEEQLNFIEFIKTIVKILYRSMVNRGGFDKFVILGDGTNTKIFDTNLENFNMNIDNGNIIIKNDYFRINQDFYIGWYIS
jgi:hypothetical protein